MFSIINNIYLNAGKPDSVKVADVRSVVVRKGYKDSHLEDALAQYEDMAVWSMSQDRTEIMYLDH